MSLYGLKPTEVWRHFDALCGIPRPSGREQAARDWAVALARQYGAESVIDAAGNAILRVAASPGAEGAPPVAIQAHLDMVCEKRPDIVHDFLVDPIRPVIRDGWVFASGTTLGSDNGIGVACALAAMTDPETRHPALDLILTVEEETGLYGAAGLDGSLVRARRLINLDSEDPSELTIGCAGGAGANLDLRLDALAFERGILYEVRVSGLKGGHSGVQIHEPLANANKLLVQALRVAFDEAPATRLCSIEGGNAHNAIPRDARATLLVAADEERDFRRALGDASAAIRSRWAADEPGLEVEARRIGDGGAQACLTPEAWERLVTLLFELPHGVLRWSTVFDGKVETSANLATIRTAMDGDRLHVQVNCSIRSFIAAEVENVQAEIRESASRAGAELTVRDGYPGWEPNPNSEMARLTADAYERIHGSRPRVEVIHAGLECGVIADRVPGLDAVSFGPRIRGAHTPEECVEIASVATTWTLLQALLADLAG